jgi:hypothetical protein
MNRTLRIVGLVLTAVGAVWFFQGIGVLPGSFMTGQTRWAIIGVTTAAAGVVLSIASRGTRQ